MGTYHTPNRHLWPDLPHWDGPWGMLHPTDRYAPSIDTDVYRLFDPDGMYPFKSSAPLLLLSVTSWAMPMAAVNSRPTFMPPLPRLSC